MKRTPLKRKTGLKSNSSLKSGGKLRHKAKKKPGRIVDPSIRNDGYLKWVRSLHCCRCERPADDAHHIIGIGGMGGAGTKAPDTMTMPVCRECHDDIHRDPSIHYMQFHWIKLTLGRAMMTDILPPELLIGALRIINQKAIDYGCA